MVSLTKTGQESNNKSEKGSPDGRSHQNTSTSFNINPLNKQKNQSQDSTSNQEQQNTSINLLEWVYEYFMNRYGLKNVADKKYRQLIGSILRFNQVNPRFQLFGRFLQLYDDLSEVDLKLYFEILQSMYKNILNFNIQEDDETIYIPLVSIHLTTCLTCRLLQPRAIDYFRLNFASRLTSASLQNCLKVIRRKQITLTKDIQAKYLFLQPYQEAVILDDFAEFVIHTTNQL